jgi:hypothetical protein
MTTVEASEKTAGINVTYKLKGFACQRLFHCCLRDHVFMCIDDAIYPILHKVGHFVAVAYDEWSADRRAL